MGFARLLSMAAISAALTVGLSGVALAEAPHDRTQFGRDISVGPGEVASDVTCFACSVRIRGKVTTDVTTFGGNIVVEDQGDISGDTTAFGGDVHLDQGTKVNAITIFGGRLYRDPSTVVSGDITTFTGTVWLFLIFVLPFIVLGAFIALIVWIVRRLTRPAVAVPA